ncbi:AhpC/TSA family protein [Flavihumibacter sp. RY-1]|uniref:AhpC/TSA family protein n=1 Tax=Flavihumibacter fluminis TaxID=2909236 RepID=A0ABS9BM66_9BACT|nr:TlpA disulfide reductase family protein [Flavihumibacter fluminis]MCF1716612.1 AhpC/TSA family protein [Flavihumibacter fluminis]
MQTLLLISITYLLSGINSISPIGYVPASRSSFQKNAEILGAVTGFDDGTWIYFSAEFPVKIFDSVQIRNNKFRYVPTIDTDYPVYLMIHTKDYRDYKRIWIEKKKIEFIGSKGEFKNSIVKNSVSNTIHENFEKRIEPYLYEIDSLRRNVGTDDPAARIRIAALDSSIYTESASFIYTYPESIVSSLLLFNNHRAWGKEKSKRLFDALSKENKQGYYGLLIDKFLALNREINIGDKYTDIRQLSPEGKQLSLSDYEGKLILLEFWASWCGPCRKENPLLVKLYNKYHARGFEIFGVSADADKRNWINAIKTDQLNWPQVSELNGGNNSAMLTYGIAEIPFNYLIDKDGKIIAQNLRGAALEKKLSEIFR